MISRGRLAFVALSLVVVLFVVAGSIKATGSRAQDEDGSDSLYKYLAVFTEVLSLVDRAYVDETKVDELMTGAFEGATDALDPFSLYVPADRVDAYLAASAVGSRRSGLLVLKDRGVVFLAAVEKGSPAEKAGLARGDILSQLQGRSTRGMPLWEIRMVLAGEVGTEVEVERLRLGQQEKVKLVLAEFQPSGVVLEQKRGLAVLTIHGFHPETPTDVAASLETLAAGSATLPGLVATDKLLIDLRGVAGGEEATAYRVAELFATGELGALKAREKTLETFKAGREPLWQGKLAVLVDQGTQGPAEVLATVLHQARGAKLVGTETFGHSGRLGMVELSNGARLQITDAFFTGPDQKPIIEGLTPDVEVRLRFGAAGSGAAGTEEQKPVEDPVLERGLEVLSEGEEPAEKQAA